MRNKYLSIFVLATSILFMGCKNKHDIPDQTQELSPMEQMSEQTSTSGDDAPVEVRSAGYVLENKERAHKDNANIHGTGTMYEYTEEKQTAEEKSLSGNNAISENIGDGYRIFLDPGHGGDAEGETMLNGTSVVRSAGGAALGNFPANSLGTTAGTSGGGYSECDVMYQLALEIKKCLESEGYEVTLSREDVHPASAGGGTAIGNWERGRVAATYDAWVVLHADGGGGSGYHCVVHDNDPAFRNDLSDDFISYMEKHFNHAIYSAGGFNHGYSGNSSGQLQGPAMFINSGGNTDNMLYIEAGFMDNPEDLNYMISEQGKKETAESVAYALSRHFLSDESINEMLNDDNLQLQ